MNGEQIFSMIILIICCCGTGGSFLLIARAVKSSKIPASLWANGKPIDPGTVSDVSAYNAAFSRMLRRYSAPYFLMTMIGLLGINANWGSWAVLLMLIFWLIAGTVWLILEYRKIQKTYISP